LSRRDVIGIGASAGGVEALQVFLSHIPGDFPARFALTIHRSPTAPSVLPMVLSRCGGLTVVEPHDGETFARGRVYLAPRDHHMTVRDGLLRIDRSPKQHHTRPAIDPLFSSLAEEYGERVIGVLLTGNLNDGVTGLVRIKEAGGVSVVQDPAEARFPGMPGSALMYDHVDVVVRLDAIFGVLSAFVRGGDAAAAIRAGGAAPPRV
jgi:two-component system, chemotaxis family, protein-glutamate methylesterase/glutaminase